MRKVSFVLLALVMAFAVGCGGSKPKDLIVGKWEPDAKDMPKEMAGMAPVIEFKSNGDMTVAMGPMNMSGKYKFVTDNEIEMEMEFLGKKDTKKMKVEVTKDTLTTTDDKGKVEKMKRKAS